MFTIPEGYPLFLDINVIDWKKSYIQQKPILNHINYDGEIHQKEVIKNGIYTSRKYLSSPFS